MILGLMSDTHGNLSRAERGVDILRAQGADHLLHCGDLGGEDIVTLLFELREQGLPVTAVIGNVDEWDPDLKLYAAKLDLPLPHHIRLELDGLRLAIHHGHDKRLLGHLRQDPDLDLLFTGHTHLPADDTDGPVRVINPGALHRATTPGVATFDTQTRKLTLHPLSKDGGTG